MALRARPHGDDDDINALLEECDEIISRHLNRILDQREETIASNDTSDNRTDSNSNIDSIRGDLIHFLEDEPAQQVESDTLNEAHTTNQYVDDDVIYVSEEPGHTIPSIDLCTPDNTAASRKRKNLNEVEIVKDDDSTKLNKESICKDVVLKCAVCLESALKRKPTALVCGHIFCQKCIYQALQVVSKCPLCRAKINKKGVIPLHT